MICLVKPPSAAAVAHRRTSATAAARRPAARAAAGLSAARARQLQRRPGRVPDDRWGPLPARLLHFSFGQGSHFLGAARRGRRPAARRRRAAVGEFRSGAHRGTVQSAGRPALRHRHGRLGHATPPTTAASTASATPASRCSFRSRFTSTRTACCCRSPSRSIARRSANCTNHFAQAWNYRYSPATARPSSRPAIRASSGTIRSTSPACT